MTAAAPAVAIAAPVDGGGAEAEEKTEFDVVLTAVGDKKIQVIKGSSNHYRVRAKGCQRSGRSSSQSN